MANLFKYLGVTFKGICMGAADVIPGVSGGTIAFLMGIYSELLDSIKSVNGEALKLLSQNKYSVSEIANLTGFSSSGHFVKVFRERLNTTPGKYRSQKN